MDTTIEKIAEELIEAFAQANRAVAWTEADGDDATDEEVSVLEATREKLLAALLRRPWQQPETDEAAEPEQVGDSPAVSASNITVTFSLPDDFGEGWGYETVLIYGASHCWAGSYDRTESGNFAHEALLRLQGVESSYLLAGIACNVSCSVENMADAFSFQSRLEKIVRAFGKRKARYIDVRGSNFYDSLVTEYSEEDRDLEVVCSMPYLSYVAKYVPLAEYMPAVSGLNIADLKSLADEHQAKHGAKPVAKN